MLIKVNDTIFISDLSIVKIETACDDDNGRDCLRIYTDDEQYEILDGTDEFAAVMKYLNDNTFKLGVKESYCIDAGYDRKDRQIWYKMSDGAIIRLPDSELPDRNN